MRSTKKMLSIFCLFMLFCLAHGESVKSVRIGSQVWMAENLNVSAFRNGDPIMETKTNEEWKQARKEKKPAWCYYNNDPENGNEYGKLYNWWAVIDPRGLAPEGWRIPRAEEWEKLTRFLNPQFPSQAGDELKEAGTQHWAKTNKETTNSSGFTALPGGYRDGRGTFKSKGTHACFWATQIPYMDAADAQIYTGGSENTFIHTVLVSKKFGLSVRCLKGW